MNPLRPRALPPRATIGIWAPSGALPDVSALRAAVSRLEGLGHRVVVAPGAEERDGYFAGSALTRLRGLRTLVDDPTIDLVMAARGGFGLSHLLPDIDWAACAASGKLFCGFSDFTAFHLGLFAQTGQISIAGPMACSDFQGEIISTLHAEHFWGWISQSGEGRHTYPAWESDQGAACAGRAAQQRISGTLWGGNLTMLAHLVGTPWFPVIDDGILFIEDIGETPYRLERALMQLALAGILARQQAIITGAFTACTPAPHAGAHYTVEDVLAATRARFAGPVVTGLAFGHVRDKLALPFGARAELFLDGARCQLSVSPQLRV